MGVIRLTVSPTARHAATCEVPLSAGANAEAKTTGGGGTALHIAAFRGHTDTCLVLLAADADKEAANDDSGWTSLHFSAFSGHAGVCKALLSAGADKEARDRGRGRTGRRRDFHFAGAHPSSLLKRLLKREGGAVEWQFR